MPKTNVPTPCVLKVIGMPVLTVSPRRTVRLDESTL